MRGPTKTVLSPISSPILYGASMGIPYVRRRREAQVGANDANGSPMRRRCGDDARLGWLPTGAADAYPRSGRLTPATVRGYRELSDAGKTAHLDPKTRELIAIAVGVTRQCDGCITTHVHAARQQGATARYCRGAGRGDRGQCRSGARLLGSGDGRVRGSAARTVVSSRP